MKPSGVQTAAIGQRLDRWLWFARIVKTRTLASALVDAGKVRVNAARTVKVSHALRVHDVLTIAVRGHIRILRVKCLGTRRGPPYEAQALYEDLSPGRTPAAAVRPLPAQQSGRPSKRDRRALTRLKSAVGFEDQDANRDEHHAAADEREP